MAIKDGPESARVQRLIRDEILDGVRPPGSKLVERDLAQELGVSRIPVREALRALVSEGLVTPRPNTWAVVREFSPDDVEDLLQVRGALESLAFRLAAARIDDDGTARLRAAVAAERAAAEAGDAVAARRAAADFHELVVELSGNGLLVELETVTRSRMRWLLGQHEDLRAVADEHERLLEAVVAHDVDRVETLVTEHLASSREWQQATGSSTSST